MPRVNIKQLPFKKALRPSPQENRKTNRKKEFRPPQQTAAPAAPARSRKRADLGGVSLRPPPGSWPYPESSNPAPEKISWIFRGGQIETIRRHDGVGTSAKRSTHQVADTDNQSSRHAL